jgi:Bacterial regulatory proteins, luxR family
MAGVDERTAPGAGGKSSNFVKEPTTFAKLGAHIPRGVLLVGRTLLADGKTNRQITEALVLSDKTVKRHLTMCSRNWESHPEQPQQPFCFEPNCLEQWAERSVPSAWARWTARGMT